MLLSGRWRNIRLYNHKKTTLYFFGGILALIFSGLSNADIQAKTDRLKSCLDKNIKSEVSKEKPNREAVMKRCTKHLAALTVNMTPEGKAKIKQSINAGIQRQLKDKK